MKLLKKSIKIITINAGLFVFFSIPIGGFLNYKSTGKFFIKRDFATDSKCVDFPIDPVFGYKTNTCEYEPRSIGFKTEFKPESKKKDFLDILILGGSVAEHLTTLSNIEEDINLLLEKNKKLSSQYSSIRVFNSATNGKKQPQGLFAFQALEMLGYDFDAIIELSGFNEIALSVDENYKNNINPIYPRLSPQQFLGNARRLTNNFANNFIERLLWMHPLHQYLSSQTSIYYYFRIHYIDKSQRGSASRRLGMNFLLPNSQKDAFRKSLYVWSRASSFVYNQTKNKGAVYLLAFQPNQYLKNSKVLTLKEQSFISKDGYPNRLARLLNIKAASFYAGEIINKYYGLISKKDFDIPEENILDLREIFKGNNDSLYADSCCHLNKKGMDIISNVLSNKIISLLEKKAN